MIHLPVYPHIRDNEPKRIARILGVVLAVLIGLMVAR